MQKPGIIRLAPWQEESGILCSIKENHDFAIARIGQRKLALPIDIGNRLYPYIGQRISILHTDIEEEPYLAIQLDEDGNAFGAVISPRARREKKAIRLMPIHNFQGINWSNIIFKQIVINKWIWI